MDAGKIKVMKYGRIGTSRSIEGNWKDLVLQLAKYRMNKSNWMEKIKFIAASYEKIH